MESASVLSNQKMTMCAFELKNVGTHASRRISKFIFNGKSFDSPSLMVTTSRFTIPNLTPDVFQRTLKPGQFLSILGHYESLAEDSAVLAKTSPIPMSKLCGYLEDVAFASRETPYYHGIRKENADELLSLNNGPDWISLYNLSGSSNMSLSQLLPIMVKNLKPSMVLSPTDHYLSKNARLKRIKRSSDSSKRYMEFVKKAASELSPDEPLTVATVVLHAAHGEGHEKNFLVVNEMISRLKDATGKMVAVVCDEESLPLFSEHRDPNTLYFARGPLSPEAIVQYHQNGFDIFETLYASEAADLGIALNISSNNEVSRISIKDEEYFKDFSPLMSEEECGCVACAGPDKTTKSYIHHLYTSHELLGPVYLTSHNLFQYGKLIENLQHSQ